jgi:hypothetical protein
MIPAETRLAREAFQRVRLVDARFDLAEDARDPSAISSRRGRSVSTPRTCGLQHGTRQRQCDLLE